MVLIDKENRDVLHLYPMALFQRPTPEAIEEFFVLEGRSKSGSRHLSIPAMLEVETEEAWTLLEEVFLTQKEAAIEPGLEGIESPFLGLQSFSTAHAPCSLVATASPKSWPTAFACIPLLCLPAQADLAKAPC